MKITADTNLLVRAATGDDPAQARIAADLLRSAELVAVPLPVLCEFVWVLQRGYRRGPGEIVAAIRKLMESGSVTLDRAAVETGLAMLEAGGDFADGAIAAEGARLGATVFASFDRQAVEMLAGIGIATHLLATE
jgi:predicted nucleic-acid-binding protein